MAFSPWRGTARVAEHVSEILAEHQRSVVVRVVAQAEARREHVVVYLSGAHAFGVPSPDSDLDLKAIHVVRTADLRGLTVPVPIFDEIEAWLLAVCRARFD